MEEQPDLGYRNNSLQQESSGLQTVKTHEPGKTWESLKQWSSRYVLPITRMTLLFALGLLLAFLAGVTFQATAQSVEEEWIMPVNLSQSGAATEPRIVVDMTGQLHVLWLDALDGVTYTRMSDEGWSVPKPITSPFPKSMPLLVADGDGRMHAFWRNEENILVYSHTEAADLTDPEAWTDPLQLTISVLALDAVIGKDGRLHLIYLKNVIADADEDEPVEEDPAGVYYLSSSDSGETWSEPVPLYHSLYFRLLEAKQAHVQIATANESVYAVWDDTPGERVSIRRSPDGGQTWEEIRQVDGREELDGLDSTSPSQIRVLTNDQTVYLHWQAGHEGVACTQYYQASQDGGHTWQPRRSILEDSHICSENSLLFFHNDLLLFLLTGVQSETYLLAWDGNQWSELEEQVALAGFLNPETFHPLALRCHQGVLAAVHFYLLGCDNLAGGDIWLTSRPLGNLAHLFPSPSIWHSPQSIASVQAAILAPVSAVDDEGRIHILWSLTKSAADSESFAADEASIYYARWDGTTWLGPIQVLISPSGTAKHLSVTIDGSGRLLLIWSGGAAGGIYFSQVNAAQANVASAWAEPILLPASRVAVTMPDILIDPAGIIYVVYVISLNENRGIYLTKSSDGGKTWSDPVTAFDGVLAGWAMVGDPYLSRTSNGNLYLLWTHYALPPSLAPLALYYAHSDDGGDTWSAPELVAEETVIWSEIRGLGERSVHRAWQERSGEGATLWHEYSLDSGLTWSRPSLFLSGFDELVGPAAFTVDRFDRLHLLQMNNETLRHWLWGDDGWLVQEELKLGDPALSTVETLTAAVAKDDNLAAIYVGLVPDKTSGQVQGTLFFASRPLNMVDRMPTSLSTLMPTPLPTATITPTPGPSPTPTVVFSTEISQGTGPLLPLISSSRWGGVIVGLIPAALLVLIIFLVGIWLVRVGRG